MLVQDISYVKNRNYIYQPFLLSFLSCICLDDSVRAEHVWVFLYRELDEFLGDIGHINVILGQPLGIHGHVKVISGLFLG